MLGFCLFFFSVKSETCGDLCQNTLNESGSVRAFCETECGSASQQLTDKIVFLHAASLRTQQYLDENAIHVS